MPILDVEKVEFLPPMEGEDYIVVDATQTVAETQQGKTPLVKVALEPVNREDGDNNIYNEGLWISGKSYTPTGKLGSFLQAFEDYYKEHIDTMEKKFGKKLNFKDIDQWIGAIIRILTWTDKNRKIQVRGYADDKLVNELRQELHNRQR